MRKRQIDEGTDFRTAPLVLGAVALVTMIVLMG